jgi:hypothetical protein
MNATDQPTDLLQSSKQKYSLSQARLRRGHLELTLLSLCGSLEDGLRGHLLLHGKAVARDDWPTLIARLREDSTHALAREEADQLQRLYALWRRLSYGEAVTITEERVTEHVLFAAQLLPRYGVLVVAPEQHDLSTESAEWRRSTEQTAVWQRRVRLLLATLGILLVLLTVGTVLWQVGLPALSDIASDTPSDETARAETGTASRLDSGRNSLQPGSTAYIQPTEDNERVALYANPGSSDARPLVYLSPGTAVQVVEGPVEAEGVQWWKVRVVNQEGWCPDTLLETRRK